MNFFDNLSQNYNGENYNGASNTNVNSQGFRGAGNKIPKGYRYGRIQEYTPEQMEMLEQMMSFLDPDSPLFRMASGDQSYFDEMEKPALRQAGQLQGNMASRFSGQGMGGRHSSGFQNESSQSMNEFAQGLQSKRTEMMMQAIRDLMSSSSMLLDKRPYEQFITEKEKKEKKPSGWSNALPIAGGVVGGIFGGPSGAYTGYQIGSAGQQAFSR